MCVIVRGCGGQLRWHIVYAVAIKFQSSQMKCVQCAPKGICFRLDAWLHIRYSMGTMYGMRQINRVYVYPALAAA